MQSCHRKTERDKEKRRKNAKTLFINKTPAPNLGFFFLVFFLFHFFSYLLSFLEVSLLLLFLSILKCVRVITLRVNLMVRLVWLPLIRCFSLFSFCSHSIYVIIYIEINTPKPAHRRTIVKIVYVILPSHSEFVVYFIHYYHHFSFFVFFLYSFV